ncbi:MAG: 2Fe-2S iron-sulfur cluster binding domain-containing protein [Clostridiales bacterium]|nr:2Fe-2S iron-sulfur cluster binding domain-containing protein [Clostridiales bacterium]
MKNVNLKVNGVPVTVPEGTRILDAAIKAGFKVPTLCYMKDLCNESSCRICVVELKNNRKLMTACSTVVAEGMEVLTNTPKVRASRKITLELMLSNHHKECLSCVRSGNCELQALATEYGCDAEKYSGAMNSYDVDNVTEYLVRDNNKCILCRRCVAACNKVQTVGVIDAGNRGFATRIASPFDKKLGEVPCVACGQCINVCPTGALRENDSIGEVEKLLADPTKTVIVGTAPAVRAALGEEFGYPIGTDVEGKMVAALKAIGFDKVFDVNMTADLTIMEEGTEFLSRLNDPNATLPMITSCSPGWIRFIEFNYPDQLEHLSSCKSPQQMFGAVMKTYYAQKLGIDPKNLAVVTVMPCIAKKFEITRDDQNAAGVPDIDASITTRELARMIKNYGIDFKALDPKAQFDDPIGMGSTAGLLFGATGGVMEAALRTVAEKVTGEKLENIDFKAVRGVKGIKEATITVGGKTLNIAVASGLGNARKIMDDIKAGKSKYHFIEIMCCPGGCVNGGGQPIVNSETRNLVDIRAARAKVLYKKDKKAEIRKSHENPIMQTLYSEFFGEPNSHKAHEILHTSYVKRDRY